MSILDMTAYVSQDLDWQIRENKYNLTIRVLEYFRNSDQ